MAAGLQVELEIEIFAMVIGGEGTDGREEISHDIEILTETETILLPVKANILCCLTSHPLHVQLASTLRTVHLSRAISIISSASCSVLFGNTRWVFSKA